jgi:hypothetical protein
MRYIVGLLCLGIVSCQLPPDQPVPVTPELIESTCYREDDEFKKTTMYFGPSLNVDDKCSIYTGTNDPKATTFALHARFSFDEWSFFDKCYAKGGKELPTQVRDREVVSGYRSHWCVETLTVLVSKADLQKVGPEGLALKFFGKRREWEVTIPQVYAQGWLSWLAKQ